MKGIKMKLNDVEFETELIEDVGLIVTFKQPISKIHYKTLELIYMYCDLGCPSSEKEFYKLLNDD